MANIVTGRVGPPAISPKCQSIRSTFAPRSSVVGTVWTRGGWNREHVDSQDGNRQFEECGDRYDVCQWNQESEGIVVCRYDCNASSDIARHIGHGSGREW